MYERSNGVGTLQQQLTASDGASDDMLGYSVSRDGDSAVIGTLSHYDSGSAYVFSRSNGIWTQQAKLTASDSSSEDYFGNSVSIDGDTAIIGSAGVDSAYVYERSNGIWTDLQKLTASDGASSDEFGYSVSIDNNMAVIGSYGGESAYVYERSNGIWTELQKLTASDGASSDELVYS